MKTNTTFRTARPRRGPGPGHSHPIPTQAGVFHARFSERGLAELHFPDDAPDMKSVGETPDEHAAWLRLTRTAIEQMLAGKRPGQLPPLDLRAGTEFQRAVWKALSQIPINVTLTYSKVAERIGRPAAVRAVGQACGANPIPLFVPCHRVLAADGGLGGFTAGLDWKRRLLEIEGVRVRNAAARPANSKSLSR